MGLPFKGHSSAGAFGHRRELAVGLSSSHQVAHSSHIAMEVASSCATALVLHNFAVGVQRTAAA